MSDLKILMKSELKEKVCVVVGTRPGIIKFSPIIRELINRDISFFILHTGQHYSYEMDKIFFDDLELTEPKYHIDEVYKEKFHGGQTAKMLIGAEQALLKEKPCVVLVGGDANTNFSGALAARKLGISVGHIEAGLRSNDWRMPEEHNRIMIDHISEYLFAPTDDAKKNLIRDNVKGQIFVTGNTIVDAVSQNILISERKSNILNVLKLKKDNYFLLTIHREENVDYKENFKNILSGIKKISDQYEYPIIFPAHPRTVKRLNYFKLIPLIDKIHNLNIIPPQGYLDFLMLLKNCNLILTDSGGIQEESCILKIPCVTLRENTERPETLKVGSNYVSGSSPSKILEGVRTMLYKKRDWPNPFGEGASKKIISIIEEEFNLGKK